MKGKSSVSSSAVLVPYGIISGGRILNSSRVTPFPKGETEGLLYFFKMLFFMLLNNISYSKRGNENNENGKDRIKDIYSFHSYSSCLSKYTAHKKSTPADIKPYINKTDLNFSAEITGPNTTIATTNLLISYRYFATFCRWILSNLINVILWKLAKLVKLNDTKAQTVCCNSRIW